MTKKNKPMDQDELYGMLLEAVCDSCDDDMTGRSS